jgi:uncharacterized membrane protein
MEQEPGQDPIASLERRLASLERTVARLVAESGGAGATSAPRSAGPAQAWLEARAAQAPARPRTGPQALPGLQAAAGKPAPGRIDVEQWLGARGLLLVGVVALLAAAAFFLKYAFDRGWVAPELRVLAAVAAGVAVAAYGERQVRAGLRRFGLALVGAGGGLVYLGIWAAAGPYVLIGRHVGIVAISLVAAVVAWRAVRLDAEPLALWALLGAFMAPVLLRTPYPSPQLFLGYLGIVGFATAGVAQTMAWRAALSAGLYGGLGLALALVPEVLHTPLGFLFLTTGGLVASWVRDRSWLEAHVVFVLAVWVTMVAQAWSVVPGPGWVALLGAAGLLLAGWWQHRQVAAFRVPRLTVHAADDAQISFVVSPVAFATVAALAGGTFLRAHPQWAFAAVAALYLATGWRGRWAAFVALGWGLACVAVSLAFRGVDTSLAFSAMIAAGVAADRWQDQEGLPPITLIVMCLGGVGVLVGLSNPEPSELVLTGAWSGALYAYVVAAVLAAGWWVVGPERTAGARVMRDVAWSVLGLVIFAGVSLELRRLFDPRRATWEGAGLAGGLAMSIWWLLYAALLVRIGFVRDQLKVRWAGLAVAALAAIKIAFFDLSRLEALYRVAAFFGLALIALAVAYGYNKRGRATTAGSGAGSA